jgi:phosphoribosyl 1,2-cyclic phosphodiesterase
MIPSIAAALGRRQSIAIPDTYTKWNMFATTCVAAAGGGLVAWLVAEPTTDEPADTTVVTRRDDCAVQERSNATDRSNFWSSGRVLFGDVVHSREAPTTKCEMNGSPIPSVEKTQEGRSKLLFLGSGSSTGCPRPLCPLIFSHLTSIQDNGDEDDSPEATTLRSEMKKYCQTSNLASIGNPVENKDYRNNPSLVISIVDKDSSARKNVIIDVGKTFREGALRWLPMNTIRSIDAIVLTHEHMDAAAGLDDVRGFQKYQYDSTTKKLQQQPMPLFLSDICLPRLQNQFPWLLPKPKPDDYNEPIRESQDQPRKVSRHVASFDVTVFQPFRPFSPVPGLSIIPLPVMHGEDLVSYGFAFTIGGTMNVVYLSDISRMLPETLAFIQTQLPHPIHILVLDALLVDSKNPVHYCLPQSVELIQQLQPLQTYLVGMNCDSFGPHDAMNEKLRQEYGNVQLAHDGLVIYAPPNPTNALPTEDNIELTKM